MNQRILFAPICVLLCAALAPWCIAQPVVDEASPPPAAEPVATHDWRGELTMWIWLVGIEGDIGVRGLTADVDADFTDVLDASDSVIGLSGRLELGYGPIAGFVDGTYTKVSAENQSGPLGLASIDVSAELSILDFGLMYRIGDWTPTGSAAQNPHHITLDLYAGGRYMDVDVELEPALAASRQRDVDWVDPIIGAKFILPLAKHVHLLTMGDIGGFGVESDLTWSATAALAFDFTLFNHPASILAGYRAIGHDFNEGSGPNEFTWDATLHGPLLGFTLAF